MKKFAFLILAFILVLSSCDKSSIGIADGAYTCSAQEFIDLLNDAAETSGVEDIEKIPAYSVAGNELDLSDKVSLTLSENKDGQLREIEMYFYHWGMTDKDRNTVSFYYGHIVGLLSPDDGERVRDELGVMTLTDGIVLTEAEGNGSYYEYTGYDGVNTLTVKPQ